MADATWLLRLGIAYYAQNWRATRDGAVSIAKYDEQAIQNDSGMARFVGEKSADAQAGREKIPNSVRGWNEIWSTRVSLADMA